MTNILCSFSGQLASVLRRSSLFTVVALLLIPAACTTANVATEYYDVSGSSIDQVIKQVKRHGPNSGKAIGQAQISTGTSFWTEEWTDHCRISDAEVELDIKIILPQFSDINNADAKTRRTLKALGRHVEWHERQHVEIAKRHARKLESELKRLPSRPNCRLLVKDAKKVIAKVSAEHKRAQDLFDKYDS